MRVGASMIQLDALRSVLGFHRTFGGFVRRRRSNDFLPYRRRTNFENTRSGMKLVVYYERELPNLDRYTITFLPEDSRGLQADDIMPIFKLLSEPRITLLEVAFDFPAGCGINGAYIRRRALFGKARPYSVGHKQGWDAWGSRKGPKFVRSYYKQTIGAHRLELELHRRFLRQHGIDHVVDFHRLIAVLPRHQILFGRLDEQKIVNRLWNSGVARQKILHVLREIAKLDAHLWDALKYLRTTASLKNVRRFLVPVRTNRVARDALRGWAAKWPTALPRRGEK
ncbi:MAG: hypothetical protein WBC04_26545 [Candidatus Acidiferrales bacterium]